MSAATITQPDTTATEATSPAESTNQTGLREGPFGNARCLSCRECGHEVELGLEKLWVKDDSTNPTNSFKDRVVACALSAAVEMKAKVFACPSTGN